MTTLTLTVTPAPATVDRPHRACAAKPAPWACSGRLARQNLRTAERARCLPVSRWLRPMHKIRPDRRALTVLNTRGRLERIREQDSACHVIPWWPWGALANCESGGRWDYNGTSGFDGGLQFLPSTWNAAKYLPAVRSFAAQYAYAWQAPAWIQVKVAQAWLAVTSWSQWPACSAKLGLR